MELLQPFLDYLLKERNYSQHTVTSYGNDVRVFLEFIPSHLTIKEIDAKWIRKWIVSLSNQKQTHRSINRKISSLKAFFKFAYLTRQIEHFPMEGIRNLKIEKKVQLPFSEAEMFKLKKSDFTNDFEGIRNYLIMLLFYNMGLRKTELIELKLNDYQTDFLRVLGKGNKERMLPVATEIQSEINAYLAERAKVATNNNRVFFLLKNNKKLNQTFVYRLINSYFRGITSKEKRSPHILRHSFASHLVQNGAEINAVKKLMGHASLSSTQMYVENNIEELKKIYKNSHPRFEKK